MCQDCVLWKGVFQDFTCRWYVGLDLKYGSCFCKRSLFDRQQHHAENYNLLQIEDEED